MKGWMSKKLTWPSKLISPKRTSNSSSSSVAEPNDGSSCRLGSSMAPWSPKANSNSMSFTLPTISKSTRANKKAPLGPTFSTPTKYSATQSAVGGQVPKGGKTLTANRFPELPSASIVTVIDSNKLPPKTSGLNASPPGEPYTGSTCCEIKVDRTKTKEQVGEDVR